MDLILDSTAGNRHLWGGDKDPDNVVFMDKELELRVSPDIFAVWENAPFRDDCFKGIIFDPPHIFSLTSQFNKNPKAKPHGANKIPAWYGAFSSKREAISQIYNAQKEFARISRLLFLKWNEASLSIDRVLSLFTDWNIIRIVPFRSRGRKPSTWWVKMVRKEGEAKDE